MPSWNDIKLFFRGVDIALMRGDTVPTPMILDSYEEVSGTAMILEQRLESTDDAFRMPPPPFAAWTKDQLAAFKKWSKSFPQHSPDALAEAEKFLALSKLLTGFDRLEIDPELALAYLTRLRERADLAPVVAELIARHHDMEPEAFEKEVLDGPDPRYRKAAEAIILLWYTGAFFDGRFPADSGTPENNQYIQGLVWEVGQAHPMGYSAEASHYWQEKPQPDGLYTGLGNTRDRLDSGRGDDA